MMRRTLFLLALVPGLALAQTSTYRRVEALGPVVPDGQSIPYALADSGWAVVQNFASNLSEDHPIYAQFYFRSPEGALTRMPLETAGIEPASFFRYLSSLGAIITEDGNLAVIYDGAKSIVAVDRTTLKVRVYATPFEGHLYALVGRTVYFGGPQAAKIDLDSGVTTLLPPPPANPGESSGVAGVSPDGTRAVFHYLGGSYGVQNTANGLFRRVSVDGGPSIVDRAARYAWVFPDASPNTLDRVNLANGAVQSFSFPIAPSTATRFVVFDATDRFLFFNTSASLSEYDNDAAPDYYAFDRSDGTIHLLSDSKGSRQAVGSSGGVASPSGSRVLFTSPTAGVTERPSLGISELYSRSTLRRDVADAFEATLPSAREAGGAVLSRGSSTVLWSRLSGSWSLRTVRDGEHVLTVPTADQPVPLDATDDGHAAIWTDLAASTLSFALDSTVTALQTGDGSVAKARIEPKTRTPLTILKNGTAVGLYRFDAMTGAATQLDAAAPIVGTDFDADAGRVAWNTANGVRVLTLATGAVLDIPLAAGPQYLAPRLTADGIYVSVAYSGSTTGAGSATRLYRATDGQFRRTLAYGSLLPDGRWMTDPSNGSLIYAATGARPADGVFTSREFDGTPVGPNRLIITSPNPPLGVVGTYRAIEPTLPVTLTVNIYSEWPSGRLDLFATNAQAGLENAPTWTEYQVDGAGAWTRLSESGFGILRLPSGFHTLLFRTADDRGRVEAKGLSLDVIVP